jgi:hypothetical protein
MRVDVGQSGLDTDGRYLHADDVLQESHIAESSTEIRNKKRRSLKRLYLNDIVICTICQVYATKPGQKSI